MKVSKVLGLAVAVPALVVTLAQPGSAASLGAVTFAGTFQLTPSSTPQPLNACFFGVATSCQNGAESSGAAAGAAVSVTPVGTEAIDGFQITGTSDETCATGSVLEPIGTASLDMKVHDAVSGGWSGAVRATWIRAGLVAVITGGTDAVGAALVTPAGVPACGSPSTFAIVGATEIAY